MTTTRIATLAAAATLGLVALGGTALALSGGDTAAPTPVVATTPASTVTPTTTSTPTSPAGAAPAVSPEQASAVALERVGGGAVTGIERETEHGRLEWKVEIVDAGVEHDVRVDATTSAVTRVDVHDDRAGDDRARDDTRTDDDGTDDRGGDGGTGHDVGDDHGGDRGGDDD